MDDTDAMSDVPSGAVRLNLPRAAAELIHVPLLARFAAALRQAFIQPDRTGAAQALRHVADQLRGKCSDLGSFIS